MNGRRFTDKPALDPQGVRSLPADHPAMRDNRTLFPSTVVEVTADTPDRLLVAGGNNRKIGATVEKGAFAGWDIWMLSLEERATCPPSCDARAFCYGNGMQMARRYRIGDPDVFYDRLGNEIAGLAMAAEAKGKGVLIRLHVLGDFPDTEYVAFWADALDEWENVAAFGYTHWPQTTDIGKAVQAVKQRHPDRFRIRWSEEDPGVANTKPERAVVIDFVPEKPIDGIIVCPAQTDASACCATCALCWAKEAKSKTIAFIKHGPKSDEARFGNIVKAGVKANEEAPDGLRRCAALKIEGLIKAPPPGPPPAFRLVAPSDLYVEEEYQRALSRQSLALIRRIVTHFDWTKFKPPVVAETTDGLFVIDGQHSAIAAATHGGVPEIPVIVVDASEVRKRAASFVAHNRDRVPMTALQVFHGEVSAGDHVAGSVLKIVRECGGDIPKYNVPTSEAKAGQFKCTKELKQILDSDGEEVLRSIVTVCVNSRVAPLPRVLVRALRLIQWEDAYCELLDLGDELLAAAVGRLSHIDQNAKARAALYEISANAACVEMIAEAAGVEIETTTAPPPETDDALWKLGLTGSESKALNVLVDRELATRDAIFHALYGGRAAMGDVPEYAKIVDVFICKLRPKLAIHGVSIKTVWGKGYSMDPEDRARFRAARSEAA